MDISSVNNDTLIPDNILQTNEHHLVRRYTLLIRLRENTAKLHATVRRSRQLAEGLQAARETGPAFVNKNAFATQLLMAALKVLMQPGEEIRVQMDAGEQYAVIFEKDTEEVVFAPCIETMQ